MRWGQFFYSVVWFYSVSRLAHIKFSKNWLYPIWHEQPMPHFAMPGLPMPHLAMPHLAMPGQPMPIKSYNPNPKNFRQHQMPCTHAAPCHAAPCHAAHSHAAPCHAAHSHAGAGHAATCHAAGMPKTTICPSRFTPCYSCSQRLSRKQISQYSPYFH